ncbi:MAG: thioesterase domain-containing protein [Clostridium perfringens]|nr:thioesterase domain-containing protein [Clostridium perfringens]
MVLFCLPYAGGSEGIYFNWNKYLDSSISLYPISLKGRTKRFNEELYNTLEEEIEDIYENIKDIASKDDYVLYGHSMGSLLAYELYYKLIKEGIKKPKHIFFSGYGAPNLVENNDDIHTLADKEFVDKLIKLGGTPKEVIENKELLELCIPILRSDFKILNSYVYSEKDSKIGCDISVFNGKEDTITNDELLGWKELSSGNCNIYEFDGDHFFINENAESIIKTINDILVK